MTTLHTLLGKSFWGRAAFLTLATGVSHGILLLSMPVLTRSYSPADFGIFALFVAISGIFAFAALSGREAAVLVAQRNAEAVFILAYCVKETAKTSAVLVALCCSLALATPRFGWIGLDVIALFLLPISAAIQGLTQVARMWCIRRGVFRPLGFSAVTRAGFTVAGALFCAGTFPELSPGLGLILGQILGDCIQLALVSANAPLRLLRRIALNHPQKMRHSAQKFRPLFRTWFSAQLFSIGFGYIPMLSVSVSFGASAAGLISLAERVALAPTQVAAQGIADVFRQRAANDWRRQGRCDVLYRRVVGLCAVLSLPLFAIATGISPSFFTFAFGEAWRSAGVLASIMFAHGFFYFVNRPAQYVIVIAGLKLYPVVMNFMRFCGEAALGFLAFLQIFDLMGYVIAATAARCIWYCVDIYFSYSTSKGTLNGQPHDPFGWLEKWIARGYR